MKLIERQEYTDTLFNLKDKNLIKVLTGVRRCGKSPLQIMSMYIDNAISSYLQIVYLIDS